MESYDERLRSFSNGNRPWPHPPSFEARPETLADAGFFFAPSAGWPDNVVCFLCNKELGDWERSEKPLEQHLSHTANCGFAIAKLPPNPFDWNNEDELPQGEHMFRARHQTFGKWWPHDHVRGWYGTSEKMARAGFIFCPTDESADNAQCSYCSAALEGWEADDDPVHEHKRRFPHCPFFAVRPTRTPSASSTSTSASKQSTSKRTLESKKERKKRPETSTSSKKNHAPSMVRVKVEEPQVATPPSIPTIVSAMKSHHVKGITNPTSPALSVEFDLPSRNPPISTSSKANSANSDVSRKSDLSVKSNINKTLANSKKSSSAQSDKDTGHGSNMAREVRKSKEPLPSKIGVISSQSPPPVDLRSTTPQSPPRDSSQSQETIPSAVPVRSQLKAQGISVVIKKRKLTQDERDYNRARWSGISDGGESEPDHADMTVSSPNGQVASPGTTSESSPALNLLGTEKQKTVFPMDIDEDANVTQIRKQAAKRTVGPSQKINSNEDSMEGVMPRQMAKRSGGPPRKTEASSGSWSMPKQVAKRKAGRPTNIAKQEETNNTTVKPQRKASARTAAKKHTRGAKKGGKPLIEIIMDGENDHMSIVSAEDAPGRQNSTDTHPPHFKIAAHAVTEQNLGGAPSESTADESSVANDASRTTPVDRSTTPPLPPSPSLPSTPPQISKQASYSPPVTPQRQRSSSPMISTPVNMTPPIPLLATPVRRPPPIPLLSTPMRKQAVSLLDIEYADVVVVDPTTPIRRPASRADIEDWEDEEQSESPKSHLSSPFISPSQWLFDEALTTSTPKPKRSTHVPGITPRQRVRDVIGNASAMQSSTMRSSTRRVGTYDSPQAKRTTAERQFDPATTLKQNQLIDRLEVLMQGNATSEVYAVAEQALQDEVQNLRRSQNKERRLAAQESGLGSEELPFSLDSEDKVMRTPVKQRAIDLTGLDDTPRPKTPLRGTPLATVMSALGAASRRNNQGAFSPVARKTTDILKLSDLEPLPPRSEVWQPGTSKRTDAAQNITAALKATKIKIKDSEETSETTTSTTGSLFEDVDPEERERRLFLMEETGLTAKQLSMTVEEFHRACIAEQVQALEVAAGTWIQQFDDECSRLREALLDGAGTSE